MTKSSVMSRPVVSSQFCSTSCTEFVVRKRPCVVNGGGFVVLVTDRFGGNDVAVFRLEGCGPTVKDEAVLKDSRWKPILTMKRCKVGLVQLLCFQKQWNAFVRDDEIQYGSLKSIFKVKASAIKCCKKNPVIKVSLTNSAMNNKKGWDYKIVGSFIKRDCVVYDDSRAIAAQVKEVKDVGAKDVYSVVIQPGVDQAFVFGLVAVLDQLTGEDGY